MYILLLIIGLTNWQEPNHNNISKSGLAIDGYDPVAYFGNEAKVGSSAFRANFDNATYYFSSKQNLDKFLTSPAKYIPQYGGWCAYALGLSTDKVKINPERYKIMDGKLYLFYDFKGTNTLTLWEENEKELKSKADQNWNQIIQK
jgi:YHS domain-containing protein